jgi:hypothetical protein
MENKNIWIIPAVIVGYILYKKYVLSKAVSVFFKNLDFSNVSFLNPEVGLIVQINNPTDVTAEVQQIKGILKVDGIEVGSVFGITPTMLRVGSSDLRIPVTLSYDGVGRLISTFNTKGFLLEFKGTIMVDYITLPLEFSYSV